MPALEQFMYEVLIAYISIVLVIWFALAAAVPLLCYMLWRALRRK